jgi:hypothetical protein
VSLQSLVLMLHLLLVLASEETVKYVFQRLLFSRNVDEPGHYPLDRRGSTIAVRDGYLDLVHLIRRSRCRRVATWQFSPGISSRELSYALRR